MTETHHNTLWELTRGQRLRYGAAIAVMGVANVFAFGMPQVIQETLDGYVVPDPDAPRGWFARLLSGLGVESVETALWTAAGVAVALTAAAGALQYLRGRWAAIASEGITMRLRERLHEHLNALSCSYHDNADTGDLVQRCTSDVETVRVFLSGQVVEIGRSLLLLLTVLPVLLWMDVELTLVSLALLPIVLVFAVMFFRRIKEVFLRMDKAEGRLTSVLQENLTGIRVVRAFARQEFESEKFARENEAFRDRTYELIRLLGGYWSLSDILCLGQIGLTLVVGAHWLALDQISLGTLFAFLTCIGMVIWPVRHMGRVLADTGKAVVALGRLREVLETPAEHASDVGLQEAPELTGKVEIEDVRLATALRGLSLEIAAGETVALIGPPGSGKSTLIHLLLRLYDADSGTIKVDGIDVRMLDRRALRRQIAVVLQEPFLYSKTIAQNVLLGRSEASEAEVRECAATACLHESIESFEKGYDTLIGERGVTLSGGQRQRLALARALVKDAAILVLDDALSAVDTETESKILNELARRHGRRTTILIAHRLSSVLHADRIFVLDAGRIVQSGPHAELSRAAGPYRELWRIQADLEDELEGDLLRTASEEGRS